MAFVASSSFFCAFLILFLISFSYGKECEGENLPPNEKLRIGVRSRPDTCAIKSQKGDQLSMHYTGKLYSTCEKFDSSVDRNQPFEFTLGAGMVIAGWDQGLTGMCIGEKRKLTIPSNMGYGDRGAGGKIPGGATLVFDVELLDIKNRKPDGEL